jgi:hypothetical protein
MIYRRVNPQKLDAERANLDVTVTRASPAVLLFEKRHG